MITRFSSKRNPTLISAMVFLLAAPEMLHAHSDWAMISTNGQTAIFENLVCDNKNVPANFDFSGNTVLALTDLVTLSVKIRSGDTTMIDYFAYQWSDSLGVGSWVWIVNYSVPNNSCTVQPTPVATTSIQDFLSTSGVAPDPLGLYTMTVRLGNNYGGTADRTFIFSTCGNGTCDPGEDCLGCYQDCLTDPTCPVKSTSTVSGGSYGGRGGGIKLIVNGDASHPVDAVRWCGGDGCPQETTDPTTNTGPWRGNSLRVGSVGPAPWAKEDSLPPPACFNAGDTAHHCLASKDCCSSNCTTPGATTGLCCAAGQVNSGGACSTPPTCSTTAGCSSRTCCVGSCCSSCSDCASGSLCCGLPPPTGGGGCGRNGCTR